MKIKLQGIGIIKDSEIELNGLTVITGDNNSGKTTVGKVVYSLFDAVSDLPEKAEADKIFYASRTLRSIQRNLDFLYVFIEKCTKDKPVPSVLSLLFLNEFEMKLKLRYDVMSHVKNIYEGLKEFREVWKDVLDDNMQKAMFSSIAGRYFKGDIKNSDIVDFIENEFVHSFIMLEKLFDNLESDIQLIDYARKNISQTLRVEFREQIQPVKIDVAKSVIAVEDKTLCFHFDIIDNNIPQNNEPVYFGTPIKRAFFVDNPFVLDSDYETDYAIIVRNDGGFLDANRIQPHEVKLRDYLRKKEITVFESNILEKQYSEINAKINDVISGEISLSDEGDYFIDSKGHKLRFSNLATGSKLFSILKLLINKGALTDSTVLILDEPEAHLHPAWQNKFAEIIVMLVKELDVKVLLTSHSSNFVLAIDAFMRKYEINDKTNFYQTHLMEEGLAEYRNVNEDMGMIYSDFVQYLTEVKLLRDRYI